MHRGRRLKSLRPLLRAARQADALKHTEYWPAACALLADQSEHVGCLGMDGVTLAEACAPGGGHWHAGKRPFACPARRALRDSAARRAPRPHPRAPAPLAHIASGLRPALAFARVPLFQGVSLGISALRKSL